jgi:MFS family permease
MSPAAFIAWGWRIFFYIGFVVAVVGLIIRKRTAESYVFEKYKTIGDQVGLPANRVWQDMWGRILRTSLVNAMFGGCFFLSFVFGTSYMKAVGYSPSEALEIGLIAAAFMLVFMIIGSLLADRLNRRVILLTAAVTFFIFAIPYFYLINTGNFYLAVLADAVGFGFVFGFGYGAIPTFYTENFPTKYRASGASAGYQISQVYGGGLIPIIAGLILHAVGIKHAYLYIGMLVMVYAVGAIIAILLTPDTTTLDLENEDAA